MEVQAISRSVRISPRKMRFLADAIRNQSIEQALAMLSVLNKRGTMVMEKTLKSAMANAVNNAKLDPNTLLITKIEVTEGQALKRFHPSTRGRVHPYKKKSSHIRVVLSEKTVQAKKEVKKEKEGER